MVDTSKTSKAFVALTLPPELLDNFFKNVALGTTPEERSETALALSHVCRSFRRVALDCPQLWTGLCRMSGCPDLKLIELYIERSKNQPLDVVVSFYKMGKEEAVVADNMFGVVLPHSGRWRSVSWQFLDEDAPEEEFASYRTSHSWPDEINAPNLVDLSFSEYPHDDMPFQLFQDFLNQFEKLAWNAPNVRAVTLKNSSLYAIPVAINAQLCDLRVNYTNTELLDQVRWLRDFVAERTHITTFKLSLVGCGFSRITTRTVKLSSIKCLDIEVLNCKQSGSQSQTLWKESRLSYFPNVVELNVTLDFSVGEERDYLMKWKDYHDGLYSLLAPHPKHDYRYPSLEVLNVTILPRSDVDKKKSDKAPPVFIFSLSFVPSIKHLCIRSPCYMKILDTVGRGEFKKSHPPYYERGFDIIPLALETLTIDLPRVDGVVAWVKRLAKKMQDTACWDQFSESTVIQNGEAMRIPRDGVERWCEEIESQASQKAPKKRKTRKH